MAQESRKESTYLPDKIKCLGTCSSKHTSVGTDAKARSESAALVVLAGKIPYCGIMPALGSCRRVGRAFWVSR